MVTLTTFAYISTVFEINFIGVGIFTISVSELRNVYSPIPAEY